LAVVPQLWVEKSTANLKGYRTKNQSMKFQFEPNGAGRYTAYAMNEAGRQRIGEVLGKPGHWCGDTRNGNVAGPFKTRHQVALSLCNKRDQA